MTNGMSPKKQKPSGPPPQPAANPAVPDAAMAHARHEQDLENELHSIYDETGAAKPDMTKLEQARHSTAKKILIGLMVFFAVLAAIAWAGVFFFSGGAGKFSGEGVTLDIEGPGEVKSGELTTYAIRYKNSETVALGTAQIEVRLPKSFKVQTAEPVSDDAVWQIGSIAPGKDGLVTIRGVFIAPIGKDLDLQAILTYRPADFNSEFQKVATKGLVISGSAIDLAITGPSKVLPGDKVTLTFAYKNGSENSFEHLKLRAAYPPTFIPESAEPAPTDADFKEWDVAKLDANAEGKVAVTGSFSSDAEGGQETKGQVGFLDKDDAFQLQKEASFSADVLKGDLVTALILNGKPDAQPIRFGDMLRYALTYKNTGTATLGDVQLSVVFDAAPAGKVILWNDLKDKAHGLRDGNTITWTKRQVPSLGKIAAGEEGTLDFEVPVIDKPIAGASSSEYQVTALLQATVGTIDGDQVGRTAKTPSIVAKMMSDTSLAAEARYFNADNIPIGSGPLPPKVGQATTYRVFWKLTNALHDVTDLKLSAKLPSNVSWTGLSNVDAGDLKFDASSEKVMWTLNWLPTSIKTLTVSFDVALTPTEDQHGKIATLTEGTIFEATDKSNGWPLILSAPPLTTAAETDQGAAGKGRVE
ncbi:MAG: hypothetical protein RL272_1165 [Candidatus Parcubacteria bacterium]